MTAFFILRTFFYALHTINRNFPHEVSLCLIQLCWMPVMGVVDNASNENNENTRRKATVVPIKIEYV